MASHKAGGPSVAEMRALGEPRVLFVTQLGCAVVLCSCGCDVALETDYSPAFLDGWKVYAAGHAPVVLPARGMYAKKYER